MQEPRRHAEWKQPVAGTHCMVPSIGDAQKKQTHRDRKQLGSYQEVGGNGEPLFTGFPFGMVQTFWNQADVMVGQH